MFKDLMLNPTYSSYENDIGTSFYTPTLSQCVRYDRASAYFSAKALASYSKGIEVFARKGHLYRLIISSELSRKDYTQIAQGYALRESVEKKLLSQLREQLSLEEERGISNLAYLISLGIIDIKIAFTDQGIFHDKFGIMEDAAGDIICFRGSNNETDAAFHRNYEAFDITCSWQASSFDYAKITKSKETFDNLWNNSTEHIRVCNLSEALRQEIISHSKGKVVVDVTHLEPNCFLLDMDDTLFLEMKADSTILRNSTTYKMRLKRYVDEKASTDDTMKFREILGYPEFKKIIQILERDAKNRNYRFFVTERVRKYIESRELLIKERSQLGMAIKNRDSIIMNRFASYQAAVNAAFVRPLREKQMWDSFFMCTMKRSSNFSVPGSGKTSSVLGVFAFLQSVGLVKRIVMIGPKNSFGSWEDEFRACFGDNQQLKVFNIHDPNYHGSNDKRSRLLYDTGDKNLILVNYESVGTYLTELKKLITPETLLVFDEVHKVKAIGGKFAGHALQLSRDAQYTIALTGTPIPNSYCDIRNLLDILYHEEYNDFFGFSDSQLSRPSQDDINEINEKLQPFFCRTTKRQLLVPDANPDITITAQASQAENDLFHILCLKYAKNKLALIIRLLQLASNPKMLLSRLDPEEFSEILDVSAEMDDIDYIDFSEDVISLIEEIPVTAKFSASMALAEKLYHQHKPTIIWCIFRQSIAQFEAELYGMGARVGCIYGDIPLDERQAILAQFRAGKLDFLITNPHTLAESVSLHSICHDAIYFEYSYNLVHLLQSKDRIHRLGLSDDQYTQYYYMETEFTTHDGEEYSLDTMIRGRLQEKEAVMLDAIEHGKLEQGCTSQEDIDLIFEALRL